MESTAFLLGEPKDVAAGVRRFRAKHQLSQAELAVMSGVSLRTVQYLEAEGTKPTCFTAMKIADFMQKFGRQREKELA